MGRLLGDWLDGYMEYTYNSEPPMSFHLWTGISVLAGAMQRKVYMEWYVGRLFPNMYIALVGPSGRCRKSTAISFGWDLLKRIQGVRTSAQLVTQQQLIRDIKESVSTFTNVYTGGIEFHCSMTVMSSELSTFLGNKNIDFLSMLTSMYDSEDEWEYRTKTQGTDKINGLCLNLLGGTAPDWISTMIPQEAIGGGFTSRFIFVVERDAGKIVPDPTLTARQRALREKLLKDLEQIHLMAGKVKFTDIALEQYEDWYKGQRTKQPIEGKNFDGYCGRRAAHVRKLCLIMSASRGSSYMIDEHDLARAIKTLESAEATMPQAFSGLGRARYSDLTETVLDYMAQTNRKQFKHSELLRIFYRDIDSWTLGVIMQTLIEMRAIGVSIPTDGKGDKTYTLREIPR